MGESRCLICDGRTHEREHIVATYRDAEYEFCSDEHKKEFVADPERYL